MEIINETENYIVICKAHGEDSEKDIPAMLAEHYHKEAADFYCVHRLDKTAAGLLVYGRHKAAAAELTSQIQTDKLGKTYLAVISGTPETKSGIFKDLLYKDKMKQKMFPVKRMRKGVKEAILNYTVLESGQLDEDDVSLVSIKLHTGRFHQIRCQFASRRMPLVGDGKYGSRIKSKNLCLFCNSLGFYDPWQETVVTFSALPEKTGAWELFSSI